MKSFKILALVLLATFGSFQGAKAVEVGKPAPAFTAKDSLGKTHQLSDYKGKYVVLEWNNHGCPFVKAQYKEGKMQKLQDKWVRKGVAWLRVNSSAPGKEGSVTPEECNAEIQTYGVRANLTFLDPEGTLGKKYGAKTTPHMFLIDPKGKLIYAGAIDNAPLESGEVAKGQDGTSFVNYLDQALTESMDRKKVSVPSTVSYGCGVKYKD